MPLPYSLLLLQVLGFLTVSCSSANAAIVPSSLSAISDVAPLIKLNLSTSLNATIRCVLPDPSVLPVSLEVCQSVLHRALSLSDADLIRHYIHNANAFRMISGIGCSVSLDRRRTGGEIAISKRRVVTYAQHVLVLCQNFGHGGWVQIDGNEEWIVIVSGEMENGEPGVGGDGLLLE